MIPVEGVGDFQVLILGGVHAHIADSLIDACLGEIIGEDNVTGIVGIAPLALVVILVVGGRHMPALIQRHGVILIAGIVAAGANGAFTIANFHQEYTGVDHGIPVGKVGECTEGGTGMVELAERFSAFRLAQQGVVSLQTCIICLVVQRGIVPGDNAGSVEGIDVAGAAGPGHLKAGNGYDLGLRFVEGSHGVLVFCPGLLAVSGGLRHIIQGAFGVDSILRVKVVGVVSERHKVHIGAVRQIRHIIQSGIQRTGAVGEGGVGVELAEVKLISGLAHDKAPGLGGFLFIRANYRNGNRGTAVSHVFGGSIRNQTGFGIVHSRHFLAVDGHGDGGILSGVADFGGDDGFLVIAGLFAGSGGHFVNDGHIQHGHDRTAGNIHTLGIHTGNRDGQGFARHQFRGNGVGAVLVGGQLCLTNLDGQFTFNTEHGIHVEGEGIIGMDERIGQGAEIHGGGIDDAVGDVNTIRYAVEEELINVIVRDIVHGVGLIGVGIVFQILAVFAVVLGGAAFHIVAATLTVGQLPVGIFALFLGIESVVAGSVGTQVAIGFIEEAVIVAVLFHREDHAAVAGNGLSVHDLGQGVFNALVVTLSGQDTLGGQIVNDNLIAFSRQVGIGGFLFVDNQINLLGKQSLVTDI